MWDNRKFVSQRRLVEPEVLEHLPAGEGISSLADLEAINRWWGGHGVLKGLFLRYFRRLESFSVLDVGAASGAMSLVMRKLHPQARVTALDRRFEHLRAERGACITADAFALPFRDRSFDAVFCSLFLHHFDDESVVRLLASFARLARRAVLAIDLERHPVPYHFLPRTQPVLGWHPVTVHDGCLSVQASFRREELLLLARRAGLHGAEVRRHLPWFRLSLAARV